MFSYDESNRRKPPTAGRVAGRVVLTLLALLASAVAALLIALSWSLRDVGPAPQDRKPVSPSVPGGSPGAGPRADGLPVR